MKKTLDKYIIEMTDSFFKVMGDSITDLSKEQMIDLLKQKKEMLADEINGLDISELGTEFTEDFINSALLTIRFNLIMFRMSDLNNKKEMLKHLPISNEKH